MTYLEVQCMRKTANDSVSDYTGFGTYGESGRHWGTVSTQGRPVEGSYGEWLNSRAGDLLHDKRSIWHRRFAPFIGANSIPLQKGKYDKELTWQDLDAARPRIARRNAELLFSVNVPGRTPEEKQRLIENATQAFRAAGADHAGSYATGQDMPMATEQRFSTIDWFKKMSPGERKRFLDIQNSHASNSQPKGLPTQQQAQTV